MESTGSTGTRSSRPEPEADCPAQPGPCPGPHIRAPGRRCVVPDRNTIPQKSPSDKVHTRVRLPPEGESGTDRWLRLLLRIPRLEISWVPRGIYFVFPEN